MTIRCTIASQATQGAYYCSRPDGHAGPCAAWPAADPAPPEGTLPNYAQLLSEARQLDVRDEVTIPTRLYLDLLQRVCSPLAPSVLHPYPLPNPHTHPASPVDPSVSTPSFPEQILDILKKAE